MKYLGIFALLFAMNFGAQASLVNINGITEDRDLGGLDPLLFSADLGKSGDGLEASTLENWLGVDAGSYIFHKENFENPETAGWLQSAEGSMDVLTYDFGDGFVADYYLLKIGNKDVGDTHYYFDNSEALQFAYIDIADMFSQSVFDESLFNIGRISHASNMTDPPVATVPLPGSMMLFGAGLLGFAGMRRKLSV